MVGFQPEKFSVEDLGPFHLPSDTPSTSIAPNNTQEIVKAVGKECGFEAEEGLLENLEQGLTPQKKARTKGTVGLAREKAVREVKSVGLASGSKETVVPIDHHSASCETPNISKIRNQSVERASLHARDEGFLADEE